MCSSTIRETYSKYVMQYTLLLVVYYLMEGKHDMYHVPGLYSLGYK